MDPSDIRANEFVAHRSSGTLRLTNLQRYGLAVLSVSVAWGASLVLQHFRFGVLSAFLLLFAVAMSCWCGRLGPVVLALVLSTIGFGWYFLSVRSTGSTKPSGMGMRLSNSRSILQAHGGQLWAAANDGPGTSFHFTLPRYDESSHAAA